MSMDFELEDDREPLRDTPEGELWTSVLVDAVEDLEDSLKWLRSVYDERRAQIDLDLESGRIAPPRYRERLRELEREHKDRQEQVDSCTWFFFDRDSPLEFICEALSYPADAIRVHARRVRSTFGKIQAPAPAESSERAA